VAAGATKEEPRRSPRPRTVRDKPRHRIPDVVDPALPSEGALDEVRRLTGPWARVESVVSLEGGQHAATWKVDTARPARTLVVRQFPVGDEAAAREERVLGALDGLGGLVPVVLGSDLTARWSRCPTVVISWLDGEADITPTDPEAWATQLGHALATVHAVPSDRMSVLPSVFERNGGFCDALEGPAAEMIRSSWSQITASSDVLTHYDYWSGNVVWRNGALTGIVDWSGAARGPRGFDVGWCRLDLYLLFGEQLADVFLAAYQNAIGHPLDDMALWDGWAIARSYHAVTSWAPNYRPLGRADLDSDELRRRHSQWTTRLLEHK
jgi:aminoglycoside phosphotransferase (APT) family kinase protein